MDHEEKELLEYYHLSGVYFTDPYPNYQTFRTAYLFDLPLSGMNELKLLNAISKSGIDQNFNVRNKLKEKNISDSNLSSIFYDILIPNSPACRKDLDRLILQHRQNSEGNSVHFFPIRMSAAFWSRGKITFKKIIFFLFLLTAVN